MKWKAVFFPSKQQEIRQVISWLLFYASGLHHQKVQKTLELFQVEKLKLQKTNRQKTTAGSNSNNTGRNWSRAVRSLQYSPLTVKCITCCSGGYRAHLQRFSLDLLCTSPKCDVIRWTLLEWPLNEKTKKSKKFHQWNQKLEPPCMVQRL